MGYIFNHTCNCGHTIPLTLEIIKNNLNLICPGCGKKIEMHGDYYTEELDNINKAVSAFEIKWQETVMKA